MTDKEKLSELLNPWLAHLSLCAAGDLIAKGVTIPVRCKDCIYYEETFGKDSGKPCGYGSCGCTCQIITGIIYDEDFCSYGERKDNG